MTGIVNTAQDTDIVTVTRNGKSFTMTLAQLLALPAAGGGSIVQQLYVEDGELTSITGVFTPTDDTIPQQSTETQIYMSLAITPLDASNILVIQGVLNCIATSSDAILGLWRDSIEDAISAWLFSPRVNAAFVTIPFQKRLIAGSTTTRTYKMGAAPGVTSQRLDVNGGNILRLMGGVMATNMMITEITPP